MFVSKGPACVDENPLTVYAGPLKSIPLRIGAPSFVWPKGYAENVEKLKEVFSDVQLLILEPLDRSPIGDYEIGALAGHRADGLSYTVHLPAPSNIASDKNAVGEIIRTIKRLAPLGAEYHVLHLERNGKSVPAARTAGRLVEIADRANMEPGSICVENLFEPFDYSAEVVERAGVSICLDAGHLLHTGSDPLKFLDRHEKHVRMAHIHGTAGRDHRPLTAFPAELLQKLIKRLAEMPLPGPVIIENYSVDEMSASLRVLSSVVGSLQAGRS